jgi:multiple sugar transport system substrate-binding protein
VGWDSAVVHPFLALLYSNGGQFLTADGKQCAFNGPRGVETLQAELRLFQERATDTRGSVWEFPNQRVAMMTMATWYESELTLLLGDEYDDIVGVAPIPKLGSAPATVLYTWFMCVDSRSKHKRQAWDFLMWLTAELQPEKQTTRLGDFFCETLKALPGRKIDIANHQAELNDLYTSAFVKDLENSITEPNIDQGQEIKMILMNAIVDAWHGKRSAQEALDLAARKINYILREFTFSPPE